MNKDKILSKLDIHAFYREHIPSLSRGPQAAAHCPFSDHEDKSPSFSVSLETGLWSCHGCGRKGDVFAFYQALKGVDFNTALLEIAEAQGISDSGKEKRITETYNYTDEEGILLYQVCRFEPKDFRPRQKGPDGKWVYNLESVRRVPYNLPEVIAASLVILVEGEKDANNLKTLGFINNVAVTTTNGGAKGWKPEYADFFKGKRVVIIPDHDNPGFEYAETVAKSLQDVASMIKVVVLPGFVEIREKHGPDVSNWIQLRRKEGRTVKDIKSELRELIQETPAWERKTVNTQEENTSGVQSNEDWQGPILFGKIETPELPYDLLPGFLGRYCQAVSESTQTPPGLAVMLALSTIAACIQKRFEVSPFQDDYTEPLSLWTVTALDPGTRKTAVKIAMTAPLTQWEYEHDKKLEPQIKEVNLRRDINLKRIDQLKARAAKPDISNSDREKCLTEISDIRDDTPDEIRPPRLWTDDVTPERLQMLMADNGERMALLSDEGGVFEVMAGLYSDGRVNLNVFLQGHAGAPVRVDRMGRTVTLQKPALSFGLTVQPDIINDLAQGNKRRFRGNGTLARFLYCIPKSTVGHRDLLRRVSIPESVKAEYNSGVFSILDIGPACDESGQEQARILTLTNDALEAWIQFSQHIESKLGPDGEYYKIQDWASKLAGAALRIAGLFQIVKYGEGDLIISRQTIEPALDLCELLISHALVAFDLMGKDQAINDAKHIYKWLVDTGELSFTQRQCQKKHEGRFPRLDRLKEALSVLMERHIISTPLKKATGGRPSTYYLVNPFILNGGNNGLA